MGGLPVKPKVQGYVAQELFDEFEAYRASHNLNQSKALEKLLAEYFGKPSAPTLPPNDAIPTSALASLRAELAALRLELVQRLEVVESRLANESALPLIESAANLLNVSAISSADESAASLAELVDRLADKSASESADEPPTEEEAAVPIIIEPEEEAAVVVTTQQHLEPLTSLGLGRRLGKDDSTIGRNQKRGNEHFRAWSADLDPDGIAWEFRKGEPRSAQFHPLV